VRNVTFEDLNKLALFYPDKASIENDSSAIDFIEMSKDLGLHSDTLNLVI